MFDYSVAVLRVVPFDNTNTLVPSGIYDWHRQLQMFCNPDKPRCNERTGVAEHLTQMGRGTQLGDRK